MFTFQIFPKGNVSLKILSGITALLCVFLASVAFSAGEKWLYALHQQRYGETMKGVSSRSFKFLAAPLPGKTPQETLVFYRNALLAAAKDQHIALIARNKADEFVVSEKHFLDTQAGDFAKQGLVIRQNYKIPPGTRIGPETKGKLTVKEVSVNSPLPVVASRLVPAKGAGKVTKKVEENIFSGQHSVLQAYFEVAFSSHFKEKDLQGGTVADYAMLYPLLGELGVPTDAPLSRMVAYSTQLLPGIFLLPGNVEIELALETWGVSPENGPVIVEISFDGVGYDATAQELQALEHFFTTVVMQGMSPYALSEASHYMGSKLQALRHLLGKQ